MFLLLLCFYYLSYRYPLQINSSTTSPTYADTPFVLQLAKYLLFAAGLGAFLLWSLVAVPRARLGGGQAFDLFLCIYLPCHGALVAAAAGDPFPLEASIFLSAILPYLLFTQGPLRLRSVRRVVSWFLYLNIAVVFVQVALFLLFGRLPALAFRQSILVRFGGIWDDPNGLAVFTPFAIGYFLYGRHSKVVTACLVAVSGVILGLTQSLTGIGATMAAVPIALGVLLTGGLRKQWLRHLAGFAAISLFILALVALFAGQSDIVQRLAQAKAVSVAIHVRDLVALLSSDATRFLGLAPLAEFGEPGYLNLSVNHGLLFAAAYLVLNVRTVLRLRSTIIAHVGAPGIEVCYAALFFVIAFNVAMLNLPVEGVFPLNGLLAAAIVLSHTGGDFDRKVKE